MFVCLFDFVGMSCMSVRPSVCTLARTEGGREGGSGGRDVYCNVCQHLSNPNACNQSISAQKTTENFFSNKETSQILNLFD